MLLNDHSHFQKEPTGICYNNNYTIALLKNNMFHKRRKHFDKCFHFSQELVNNRYTFLYLCESQDHLVEFFAKPVERTVFQFQIDHFGIVSANNLAIDIRLGY